ncbi:PqqD family protein [Actinomyces ruminicola]|uniref:PqqD family protein n=1 Tax=Actinomyces ruminicola TaxID=332524 RepID=UPI0011CB4E30|nr:PqqD family protein [Actinomyces ruminicola]
MSKITYMRTDHVDWLIGADGRMTVKDTESDWYYPLNPVASLVWDMMDGTSSIDDIADAVCSAFDIDLATARDDVADFVEQALDLNLVEESTINGNAADSSRWTREVS